jgi:hypothetical protein
MTFQCVSGELGKPGTHGGTKGREGQRVSLSKELGRRKASRTVLLREPVLVLECSNALLLLLAVLLLTAVAAKIDITAEGQDHLADEADLPSHTVHLFGMVSPLECCDAEARQASFFQDSQSTGTGSLSLPSLVDVGHKGMRYILDRVLFPSGVSSFRIAAIHLEFPFREILGKILLMVARIIACERRGRRNINVETKASNTNEHREDGNHSRLLSFKVPDLIIRHGGEIN